MVHANADGGPHAREEVRTKAAWPMVGDLETRAWHPAPSSDTAG